MCYWVFVTIYIVCMYLSVSKAMCVRVCVCVCVCVLLGVCYYIYCNDVMKDLRG